MSEDPPSRVVKKVWRREEDPLDDGGRSEQTELVGSKLFSFRDAVMNSNQLNNSLNNKIYSITEESMLKTVVIKLLERKIGYNALWKPSMRLQLMDIENDYFLAKFESFVDYLNLLWIIAIGEMVGNVIKIDLMTNKGAKGQFARFTVQIDLRKPLVSKIRIASRIHRIREDMEKGSGEAKDLVRLDQHKNTTSIQERVENERFGKWMIVDLQNHRQDRRNDDGQ
ncbi:hypothetical protein Goari_027173 [Gossypium aridum]|uniref:DUF4283 domain-containing protein n=1 Tax=Gossypium aridum TaxID=34290 RepID=A0A7J8YUB3_GOSAI|nr:hypothetical protein [Gossypium aridum]